MRILPPLMNKFDFVVTKINLPFILTSKFVCCPTFSTACVCCPTFTRHIYAVQHVANNLSHESCYILKFLVYFFLVISCLLFTKKL